MAHIPDKTTEIVLAFDVPADLYGPTQLAARAALDEALAARDAIRDERASFLDKESATQAAVVAAGREGKPGPKTSDPAWVESRLAFFRSEERRLARAALDPAKAFEASILGDPALRARVHAQLVEAVDVASASADQAHRDALRMNALGALLRDLDHHSAVAAHGPARARELVTDVYEGALRSYPADQVARRWAAAVETVTSFPLAAHDDPANRPAPSRSPEARTILARARAYRLGELVLSTQDRDALFRAEARVLAGWDPADDRPALARPDGKKTAGMLTAEEVRDSAERRRREGGTGKPDAH